MIPRANLSWAVETINALTGSVRELVDKIPSRAHSRWIGKTCLIKTQRGTGYIVQVIDLDSAGISFVMLLDVQAFNGLPDVSKSEGEGLCGFLPYSETFSMRDLTDSEQFIYLPAIEARKNKRAE